MFDSTLRFIDDIFIGLETLLQLGYGVVSFFLQSLIESSEKPIDLVQMDFVTTGQLTLSFVDIFFAFVATLDLSLDFVQKLINFQLSLAFLLWKNFLTVYSLLS